MGVVIHGDSEATGGVSSCSGYDNLVIESTTVTNANITADRLCVDSLNLESINVNASITSSGAGGLDTGTEAANTWYNVFVISNSDGSLINGLLSLSATAPTMPVGYTKKRRVGAVRNDASSNFLSFVQEGNYCTYRDALIGRIVDAGTATTFTTVSAAVFVPPTSFRGDFLVSLFASHANVGQGVNVYLSKNGVTTTFGEITVFARTQVSGKTMAVAVRGACQTDASQNVQYKIGSTPATGGAYVDVMGYWDRI